MRVISIVCLSLVMISCCLAEDTTIFSQNWYYLGYEEGINDAQGKSMSGWFVMGCLTGIPCTLVSTSLYPRHATILAVWNRIYRKDKPLEDFTIQ
jgi:hypothetical protein